MFVKKILVFNPSFLGDSVLTTPLIKALKHYFCEAEVHFCVRPEYIKLFEQIPIIDKVIPFDKRGDLKGFKGIVRFSKYLKSFHYDIIISPHKSFRSTLIVKLSKPKISIGFKNAALSFLYNKRIYRKQGLHEVEKNLTLLRTLFDLSLEELKNIGGLPTVYVNDDFYKRAKEFLNVIVEGKPIVGVNPCSQWETKMWGQEKVAELINKLYEKDIVTAIFSSPIECEFVENIKKQIRVPFIDFAGKLALEELASIIKCMNAYVTCDSGPMHIAASLSIPIVAIFGPTTKSLGFTPYNVKHIIVEVKDLYCRPCGLHGGKKCPKKHFLCMNNINVYDVLNSTLNILGIS